jgi:hypothetical protein
MSDRFAVTLAVTRPDGSVEQVRVGTAVKSADGFSLSFDQMTLRPDTSPARTVAQASRPAARSSGGGQAGGTDLVFPPYGRSKGMPISGASMQDLEFYANGSRRSLADPSKSRWHDKERALLAAIEGEIARQSGGGGGGGGGEAPFDDGIPPPGDEDAPF